MSVPGKSNERALTAAPEHGGALSPLARANPLVARGLADLAASAKPETSEPTTSEPVISGTRHPFDVSPGAAFLAIAKLHLRLKELQSMAKGTPEEPLSEAQRKRLREMAAEARAHFGEEPEPGAGEEKPAPGKP